MNIKIPIIMYHEISVNPISNEERSLTPLYDISLSMFKDQLRWLVDNGYKTLSFDEAHTVEHDENYVILTFDDGFIGNYLNALPALNQFGLKATFFIRTGTIGDEKYMEWSHLKDLINFGMRVESHTVSHRPLQTLSSEEIIKELTESKAILEKELGNKVTAISFPHGSFTPKVLRIARDTGYHYICTSEIANVFDQSFKNIPAVLGRIAMTTKISLPTFERCLKYDTYEISKQKASKWLKNTIKRTIGISLYRRIYRAIFQINKPTNQ